MWTGPRDESLTFDIGINTEGLLVFDVDDRDGRTGAASFAELARVHGLDLDTVEASTPSGGRHYFYKLPQAVDPTAVKFGSDKLGSGIDHRSYNSFVVAPGTKRPKGEYKWVRSPDKSEIRTAPQSLVDLCIRKKKRDDNELRIMPGLEIDLPDAVERFREYVKTDAPEAIQDAGGRNATIALLRLAGDYGISYLAATEFLCEEGGWNETKAIPPWDYDELLELAETLEPSRERPIGCDYPRAQFEAMGENSSLGTRGKLPPFINIAAWINRPPQEREWVVRDRILNRNVALLSGDGGVGKTIIALELAICLQLKNQQWLRSDVLVDGPAMVVCCEDDEDEFQRRTEAILAHRGGSLEDVRKHLYLVSLVDTPDRLLAVPNNRGVLEATPMFTDLRIRARDIKPRLLVIDNAADVYGGDEINRTQVNQFVSMLRVLAREAETAVLVNAHPSLQGMASGRGTSGSTQWHNSVRQRQYMRKATKEEGADLIEGLRIVETMKNSYGPGEGNKIPLKWHNGLFVPVDIKEAAVQATESRIEEAEALFLELLEHFERQGREITAAKRGIDFAPKIFSERPEAGQRGIGYKQLELAMERLLDCGKVVLGAPEGRYKKRKLMLAPWLSSAQP
jgi:RecA-family ATPase